jgi:hypothetical protein
MIEAFRQKLGILELLRLGGQSHPDQIIDILIGKRF